MLLKSKNLLVTGSVLIAIGVIFEVLIAIPSFVEAYQTNAWNTTSAIITHSKSVTTRRLSDSRIDTNADIRFSYTVGPQAYKGNRVFLGGDLLRRIQYNTEDLLLKYPVGKKVNISFNPQSPAESVLEQNTMLSHILIVSLCLFFILVGLVIVYVA